MRTFPFIAVSAIILLAAAAIACQKAKFPAAPASFTVIHAMSQGTTIVPKLGADTAGRYYSPSSIYPLLPIFYGSSQLYSLVAGTTPLIVAPLTDTAFTIFNGNYILASGGIYSFFLSGDTTHADTLLIKDNIPSYNDSSSGVRFINLATGGKAITINLAGDGPSNLQFPALGYRQLSDFKGYSAKMGVGGTYQFEIRDQASGDSLTTYSWSYYLFNNNTIVIAGSTDPTGAPLTVFAVNNY